MECDSIIHAYARTIGNIWLSAGMLELWKMSAEINIDLEYYYYNNI